MMLTIQELRVVYTKQILPRMVILDGCHIWEGNLAGSGRPSVSIKNKTYYVARVVLCIKLKRPIKPSHVASHTCDIPCCINPEHLREESYSKNLHAAWSRKRRSCRPSTLT